MLRSGGPSSSSRRAGISTASPRSRTRRSSSLQTTSIRRSGERPWRPRSISSKPIPTPSRGFAITISLGARTHAACSPRHSAKTTRLDSDRLRPFNRPVAEERRSGGDRRTNGDRRKQDERRESDAGPPDEGERRTGSDRRSGQDRRSGKDRRDGGS